MAALARRFFWFILAPIYYLGANALLTVICFIVGLVLGLLASYHGSPLFNWLTAILAYLTGIVICDNSDPIPGITTIVFGGYITGHIVRLFINIF